MRILLWPAISFALSERRSIGLVQVERPNGKAIPGAVVARVEEQGGEPDDVGVDCGRLAARAGSYSVPQLNGSASRNASGRWQCLNFSGTRQGSRPRRRDNSRGGRGVAVLCHAI